jgi:hypothetical protein
MLVLLTKAGLAVVMALKAFHVKLAPAISEIRFYLDPKGLCFWLPMTVTGDLYPKFEVRPFPGGGGWYVIITPRKGAAPEEYFGYSTEAQAMNWVQMERIKRATRRT